MTGLAAAMTTSVDYGYPDAEIAAAATAREQFDGAVVIEADWEVGPVLQILDIEKRCAAPNWDGHHSPAPTRRTMTLAIGLVRQIAAFEFDALPQPYIGPAGAGGLVFEFQSGVRELSLSLFNGSDAISYLKSEEGEPFEEEEITFLARTRLRGLLAWLMTAPA